MCYQFSHQLPERMRISRTLKTEDGEKLRELWVPWRLGEEIESETPLLLVREDEESEPRVYPARSSRGI